MSSPLVGVLGHSGAVGRMACGILRKNTAVRGGTRRPATENPPDGPSEVMRVDIHDKDSLAAFCSGCSVVLNCAGPSYLMGDTVAKAALEAGAAYVDAFGGDNLERKLLQAPRAENGLFVIGAGVFPGLSALLPRWMFSQGFDSVTAFSGYAGGREKCSRGAGADLLLSSVQGFGIPDAFWRDGRVVKLESGEHEPGTPPGFRDGAHVHPFLATETIRLAERHGLHEVRWHTVVAEEGLMEVISACCALVFKSGEGALDAAVGELMRAAELSMAGRNSWYAMTIEATGLRRGKEVRKRAILKSASSYELSGVVAASAVRHILESRPEKGVYWAFEILNPDDVLERVRMSPHTESLTVVDVESAVEQNETSIAGVLS